MTENCRGVKKAFSDHIRMTSPLMVFMMFYIGASGLKIKANFVYVQIVFGP